MNKIVFYNEKGEEEVIETSNTPLVKKVLELLRTGNDRPASDIMDRNDYVACKLWNEDDIFLKLAEAGYEKSNENLAEVLSRLNVDSLEERTVQEWRAIDDAIRASEAFLVEVEEPDTSVYFQDRDFLL